MNALVVLPTYDEAATIAEVLRRTRRAVPSARILVVDDGSPDGTADIAERTGAELGQVEVMRRDSRRGLGDAYRAGFRVGLDRGADLLIEMDSDLSHDPGALPDLLAAAEVSDLVIGSRYVPGGAIPNWRLHRRLLSKAGNAYSALMLGLPVHDMTSGFRVYRADLMRQMDLDAIRADGYGFQIEMTYRAAQAGARISEVPIRFVDREEGTSKMSSSIIVEALALVTWWGLGRLARSARRPGRASPPVDAAPPAGHGTVRP
jgi:dolichol-phosphate mannosyltransferase